jgi:hypothetical protein
MSDVGSQLSTGMEVFDIQGTKIGKVIQYDALLGYFETKGTFSGPRYVPFWAIEGIGPADVHLNVEKSVVSEVYNHLPRITPDLTKGGKLTGTGTVQSGRSGHSVPLDAEALNLIRQRIHVGTAVIDADGKELGTIEAYDVDTGYMQIAKEGLFIRDVFLPVTSVSFLDDQGIHLSETKATIADRFARLPGIARAFFAAGEAEAE